MLPKEECEHASSVLSETIKAIKSKDSIKLKSLSNQTIHSSCMYQDSGTITLAVLVYALSKLIERSDYKKISLWQKIERKVISLFELSILALNKNNHEAFEKHISNARKSLETSSNLKPYIEEVLKKASINKASKIYEHGISSGQTAKLLGLSQWEILEYIGSKPIERKTKEKITIEKRIETAMQFFS